MRPFTAHTEPESPAGDSQCCPAARSECGFTLVELLIVMVIVGILMAVLISTFSGVKSTGYHKEAVSVAGSFAESIEAFAADHNGWTPVFPDNFSNVVGSNGKTIKGGQGPTDLLTHRPYMRTPADAIKNRRVIFANATAPNPTNKSIRAIIRYHRNAQNPRRYRLEVVSPRAGDWNGELTTCYIGNLIPAGEKQC